MPLGALRVHEAFFFQSLIKHQYKLDPGSPSRLRGTFLLNPLLKLITNAPLGPLRVYGASSFETPYKRNKKETSKVHLQNHPFCIFTTGLLDLAEIDHAAEDFQVKELFLYIQLRL